VNEWVLIGEITAGAVAAMGIVAFAYVTWRLAVTRAARETIELLRSQVETNRSEVQSLREQRSDDKSEIAALRSEIAVLREMVTHAAEVGVLREEMHAGHGIIIDLLKGKVDI
jgi:cell division protein FtsB